jgi:pimeloyl-ACP methyl ester carboxylesterase
VPRLETRGVELAWESLGEPSAPATVFVHETAVGVAAWRPLAERLAAPPVSGRSVIYDRRGWGDSSAPDDYLRTTVEEQSEDLAELIGALGAPAARVCGAGLGALICLDLLLRRPRAAASAVLIEPLIPGLVPAATQALAEDRETLREAVQERGAAGMVELYLEGRLEALGPGAERLPRRLTQPAWERPATLAAELGAATAWSYPLRELGDARASVLVVNCADTPALVREAAEALTDRIAGATRAEASEPGPLHVSSPGSVLDYLTSAASS